MSTSTNIAKNGGAAAWDVHAYTAIHFLGACSLKFYFGSSGQIAAGLSELPWSTKSYTNINFCLKVSSSNNIEVFSLGVLVGSYGTFLSSDLFEIKYTGASAEFSKNGVVFATIAAASNLDLRAKIAIYTPAALCAALQFGVYGAIGNITGNITKSYIPTGITSDTDVCVYTPTTISASLASALTETSFLGSVTPPAPDVTITRIHILNLTVQNNDPTPGKLQIRIYRSSGGTFVGSAFFSPSAHTGGNESFTAMLFDQVAANVSQTYTASYSLIDGTNGAWSSAAITLSLTHLIYSPKR